MQTLNQINRTMEESASLKSIAQAYTEISAVKLRKIRAGIERNRNFFEEVSQVFRTVKATALKQKINLTTKHKGTMSILLTSNHRFYGDLENRLIQFFMANTSQFPTDVMVTGLIGNGFLRSTNYPRPFQSFIFSGDLPKLEETNNLVSELKDYQQIFVYYPRMQSVLIQEPHVVDLLQRPPERLLDPKVHHFESIFEPEVDQILQFFDTQIIMLLVEQIFLESELARTAARLTSMQQAQEKADALIGEQRKLLLQAKRSLDGIRLLDAIATLAEWRKEQYAE